MHRYVKRKMYLQEFGLFCCQNTRDEVSLTKKDESSFIYRHWGPHGSEVAKCFNERFSLGGKRYVCPKTNNVFELQSFESLHIAP